jgi:hypothetical protein
MRDEIARRFINMMLRLLASKEYRDDLDRLYRLGIAVTALQANRERIDKEREGLDV